MSTDAPERPIRGECRRRFETLENKVFLGNGERSHDARLTAAETQLRTIVWLLRTILAATLSNLVGLAFLYFRSR